MAVQERGRGKRKGEVEGERKEEGEAIGQEAVLCESEEK